MEPNSQFTLAMLLEQIPSYASAIAAISAAIAAYKSWSVSKDSFKLQRAYIQNHDLILKINTIIEKLENLSSILMCNPLELPDNEIKEGEILVKQIKKSLELLRITSADKLSIPSENEFKSLGLIYEIFKNDPMYIENLINQLIKYKKMKLL